MAATPARELKAAATVLGLATTLQLPPAQAGIAVGSSAATRARPGRGRTRLFKRFIGARSLSWLAPARAPMGPTSRTWGIRTVFTARRLAAAATPNSWHDGMPRATLRVMGASVQSWL